MSEHEEIKFWTTTIGIVFGVGGVLIGILFSIYWVTGSFACPARWPDHEVQFGPVSGCLVETSEGLIPERNFRLTFGLDDE